MHYTLVNEIAKHKGINIFYYSIAKEIQKNKRAEHPLKNKSFLKN